MSKRTGKGNPELKLVGKDETAASQESTLVEGAEGASAESTDVAVEASAENVASEPKNEQELSQAMSQGATLVETKNEARITFRKTNPKRLINAMASVNDARIEETDDSYIMIAPFIKVTRGEVETVAGKISDAKWRMLFVNRSGAVQVFNNYEFAIGIPAPVAKEVEPSRESVQLNIRIDKSIKDELELLRAPEYMDLTQNAFVEEALREFIANIKKELV